MQCILTHADYEIFFGGEPIQTDQPYSFTCPFCGRMGFTEMTLHEHVSAEHADAPNIVVCPICASSSSVSEQTPVTSDFATHFTLEHRTRWDDSQNVIRDRRAPHVCRGMGGARSRKTQLPFSSTTSLALSPGNNRDSSMDPISELLSQLSGARRVTQNSSNYQQFQMHLLLERNPSVSTSASSSSRQAANRTSNERAMRRHQQQAAAAAAASQSASSSSQSQTGYKGSTVSSSGNGSLQSQIGQLAPYMVPWDQLPNAPGLIGGMSSASSALSAQNTLNNNNNSNNGISGLSGTGIASLIGAGNGSGNSGGNNSANSQYLLAANATSAFNETDQQNLEVERADRSLFVQQLLLDAISERIEDLLENLNLKDKKNETGGSQKPADGAEELQTKKDDTV